MKNFSWRSYWSLFLSIFSMPFLFALMYGLIRIHPYFGFFLVSLSIIVSLIFGVIAVFKDTEKNSLAVLAIIIAFGSGAFFVFALLMSQMSGPTEL
ncbi:hypothetical protein [Aquibacillus rhizosphaerae]|uniref:Uncharacterized protein n=1 Tax=Aquibacillus rhizosphaerae TaxID=3051431 RepID=A0ABT7LAH2_9BACI|nr:hypothetical protein [Aquibacillus sp. LR5S19]MDL4842404.1 hypothetical protein [Aquibacillus sp. LR5S19]